MAVRIGTNISSLIVQRRLKEASDRTSDIFERLSSGMRINRASDDAAGLALATSLNADVRILTQAIRNVNDGISLASIAEASLNALSSIVTRQKELAEQAANGTYTVPQRVAMNKEANALVDEFNRIVQTTSFNGMNIYENGTRNISIQAGAGNTNIIQTTFGLGLSRLVGDETFDPSVQYTGGDQPRVMDAGDVNHDGIIDIVVADNLSNTMSVFLGNGDGTFKNRATYGISASNAASLADLNNDGHLDLIGNSEGGDSVRIFLGNGDGTFKASVSYGSGDLPRISRVGDFNNDGNLDIATGSQLDNRMNIILGNGDGTFKANQAYVIGDYEDDTEFSVGDINNDGFADIIVPERLSDTMSLLLANSDGTFKARIVLSHTNPSRVDDVELSDVNDDGLLDIIFTDSFAPESVSVQLGNGDGTFKVRRDYTVSPNPRSIYVKDFNGDGYEDLVVTTEGNNTMEVLFGNSDGSFRGRISILVGSSPRNVVAADFNGDGVADIANVNTTADTISITLQNTEYTATMEHINITTQAGARAAISVLDSTLYRVAAEISVVGAFQSRLSFTVDTIAIMRENYQAAAMRIMDVDIATETAELVRNQILQQVATALLAQINTNAEIVLKLLGND